MRKKKWTVDDIPQQDGKIAIVTGANSGLGFNTSKALALKGAKVIMACRNQEKGEMARQKIMNNRVAADPEVWHLNLASLESVEQFALKFAAAYKKLDLLFNNAGLMAIPYDRTEDSFEMQFGVNHLGHFALTARLWPLLSKTEGSRVIQVSSLAHYFGKIRFEDIHWEQGYKKWGAYGMSKLANLLFVRELARRVTETGGGVTVAAAHPGYADTELQAKSARMEGKQLGAKAMNLINKIVAQSGEKGALPSLYAATVDGVEQGAYFGPGGLLKMQGWPVQDSPSKKLVNNETADRLWGVSEALTGLEFKVR
jgi:NAD(P)-dependent dehydrogenase (short-subunit alcohol dehydrogenase family)